MKEPVVEELISLFNQLFKESLNTVLVKGDDEPIYLPADQDNPHHRVIFAHGFYASALHEIAHWCVAGPERRKLEDFGYWYKPDGRTAAEQAEFEKVEVRPQAFEWLMSKAAGHNFNFSADNLSADIGASESFKKAVLHTVHQLLEQGLPERVGMLVDALCLHSGRKPLAKEEFSL
ncbi:elongation factor P hydroxylase [uncultured Neptuniibacter sp.]|uniref:elongation factor P hydroxylase n=1 Tax=uncultured Neptuniibacter sp. TaxID=502143 RepID=UPI002628DDCE|nr:elongation factor P hydroxylase [uncultured Neptuniibacter sp.]